MNEYLQEQNELPFIGQEIMELEHDEWSDYLDLIAVESEDNHEEGLNTDESAEGAPPVEYVLPIYHCPACGNGLDDKEQCRTCGWGHLMGETFLYGDAFFRNGNVNWAEAFAEF